jgi:Alpha/beta hydrolase domain
MIEWGRSVCSAAIASALLTTVTTIVQAAPVAVATITGPIPVTAQSGEPYRGANEQPVPGPGLPLPVLTPFGYVEEEYFVSGTIDGNAYKTSLLVRKPKDPAKFSGLVAVETIHAAGAVPLWGFRDIWLPNGHAWIAVASQRAALESHLKKSNPNRYATLQIPEAPSPQPTNTMAAAMAGGPQDRLSQMIMTQVGALLKSNAKDGPLTGVTVKYLVMGGASQTGGTTLRYIENSHTSARLPNGKPIYDGYLPMQAFSSTPVRAGDAAVMHIVGEGDLMVSRSFNRPLGLRADANEQGDRYRHYQFVGAPHVVTRGVSDPKVVFSTLQDIVKPGEQLNQFPNAEFFEAAVANFVEWLMKGTAPPSGQPIALANGDILRDEFGNAKGGIRSPYVDMPTARYIASASADEKNPMRRLIGLQETFSADQLHNLYGSRELYLHRFNQGIDTLVEERWVIPADGEKLKKEEAAHPPL